MTDLTNLTTEQIEQAMNVGGYPSCEFVTSSFIRFSSGGDAVYVVTFWDENEGRSDAGYVFINYDVDEGKFYGDF